MSHITNSFTVDEVATVTIVHDDGGTDSPLDGDEAIKFAVLHRRYENPAKRDGLTSPDAIADFAAEHGDTWAEFPLYLYEHGDLLYRVSNAGNPFTAFDPGNWDSGRVGSVFVKLSEVGNAFTYAQGVCESYTAWCNGNVWGFVIDLPDEEHVDSCWGFIGDSDEPYLIEAATEAARYHAAEYKAKVATAFAAEITESRPDMYPVGYGDGQ